MKTIPLLRFISRFLVLLGFLAIGGLARAQSGAVPFAAGFWYPTNGQVFTAPASVGVHAWVTDSNLVTTMEYFSGITPIGLVTNKTGLIYTNTTAGNPFEVNWTNVPAGTYTLTAVATDVTGAIALSPAVTITVKSPPPPPPVPFFIGLTRPTNNSIFVAPTNLTIYTEVTDSNLVDTVQFFANGTAIGLATNKTGLMLTNSTSSNPFYLIWSNAPAGSYTLTAVATDSASLMATSAPVNITVQSPPPPPPAPFTLAISSPTNMQTFTAPVTFNIYTRVTDSNLVDTVEFFANDTSLGIATNTRALMLTNTSSSSPFYLTWSNVLTGRYTLTAIATDSAGLSVTSAPVNLTVLAPPPPPPVPYALGFWYPTNTQTFTAPATIGVHAWVTDSNLVDTIQYFANDLSIGLVSNKTGVLLTNNSTSSGNPFEISWSNVVAGVYALTAVATDSAGLTATSAPVTITVNSPPPPPPAPFKIAIYNPTNNQAFTAPVNLGIYTRVTDSNFVYTVQFYANSSSLGTASNTQGVLLTNTALSSPFNLYWTNIPAGTYVITAIATDAASLTATSAPVTITVNSPPPPPVIPYALGFWYPTNGQTFTAPATIGVHAWVTDSNLVDSIQYFANGAGIGLVTNRTGVLLTSTSTATGNPFEMNWSNVLAGVYTLTAVATDAAGLTATSGPVTITVQAPPPPPPVPFAVSFWYPTDGEAFTAPANVGVHALVTDSNLVTTVQYFANGAGIGLVTNTPGLLLTSSTQDNPFYLSWSNVTAGTYVLTAVATDAANLTATSAPVTITVQAPPPPPPVPFAVSILSPTNSQTFAAAASFTIYTRVTDSNVVDTLQFFANGAAIGLATNIQAVLLTNLDTTSPFYLRWTNVAAGTYTLTAVAVDSAALSVTSAPVTITVKAPPPVPFTIGWYYPTNGELYLAPATVGVHASVTDSNVVSTVQYFANDTAIGLVTNKSGVLLTNTSAGNPFEMNWSGVQAGTYKLTALATDSAGLTATSAPVYIIVAASLPSTVTVFAPDPTAVLGGNCCGYALTNSATNYSAGTNTASFLVQRTAPTNTDLTVYYYLGGSATNGLDYIELPGSVTIPAGQTYALVTIVPLDNGDLTYGASASVLLELADPPAPPNTPPTYVIGYPETAGAIIVDDNTPPPPQPSVSILADNSILVSLPATNGMNYSLQVSTDLATWYPVCTNTVLKGSANYVDPNGAAGPGLFYRAVPVPSPASY